ncbi:MAG: hup [Chthoniobacteraceae bacterium]|nr:hup [Chthoniobacteraceae bacterium]
MGTLTKRELVVQISNETGLVQHQVFDVIQRTLDLITDALAKGNNVELRNFGIMEVRLTKPRVGRNPNQPGSSFVIPARATVKFKAGKVMRQLVSERSAGMQTVAAELNAAKQKTATPKAARLVEPVPVKKRVAKKVLQ